MTLRTALPLFFAASLAACSSAPTPIPGSSAPVLPGQWTLQQAGTPATDGAVRLVLRQTPPREGTTVLDVSGFSGVNHYKGFATYDADAHMLVMGALSTTRDTGPATKLQAEGAYLQKLEQVASFEWKEGGVLVLKTLAGDQLTFTREGDQSR
ncbi:MAG TPA: META domain-containing protein [Moraxellaceae bacterium]|nr:META domain-containing protein [Moraxellaceae bacterium]